MKCPQCGSQNTQKSLALYEQATRLSEGESSGAFVTSRGTLGVSKSKHSSQSSSLAAERNKPPVGASLRTAVVLIVGMFLSVWLLFTGAGFGVFLLALAGTIGLAIFFFNPTEQDLAEQTQYSLQWYCKKCGNVFLENYAVTTATELNAATADDFVSPVMRASVLNDRKIYADRVLNPVQRAKKATARDLAGLAALKAAAQPDGSFNPEQLRCDLGIISRLASVKLINYDTTSDRFLLSGPVIDRSPTIGIPETLATPPSTGRGWWERTFSGQP